MITALEIRGKARELSLPETTIQRDYAQNWLLKHMDAMGVVLKGGTGIRKTARMIRDIEVLTAESL